MNKATWLKNLVFELADHVRDEGGLGVGEEGDRGHEGPTVVVYHILRNNIGWSNQHFVDSILGQDHED